MQLRHRPFIRWLRTVAIALLAPIAIMSSLLMNVEPGMALISHLHLTSPTFGTMSNRIDATAKDAEGKLESAYGDLTGDTGHQLKGKAKQVQASAMNVAEDVKEGARSAGKKISDATTKK
jgi:uncharacterized protein YjbJ (UPF0337 family)